MASKVFFGFGILNRTQGITVGSVAVFIKDAIDPIKRIATCFLIFVSLPGEYENVIRI